MHSVNVQIALTGFKPLFVNCVLHCFHSFVCVLFIRVYLFWGMRPYVDDILINIGNRHVHECLGVWLYFQTAWVDSYYLSVASVDKCGQNPVSSTPNYHTPDGNRSFWFITIQPFSFVLNVLKTFITLIASQEVFYKTLTLDSSILNYIFKEEKLFFLFWKFHQKSKILKFSNL